MWDILIKAEEDPELKPMPPAVSRSTPLMVPPATKYSSSTIMPKKEFSSSSGASSIPYQTPSASVPKSDVKLPEKMPRSAFSSPSVAASKVIPPVRQETTTPTVIPSVSQKTSVVDPSPGSVPSKIMVKPGGLGPLDVKTVGGEKTRY
jgi:hypothetical protein